jgi:hypothetical protein
MMSFKSTKDNPYHVYISRKPNLNGLKNWSLVDYSRYFVSFLMFKRIVENGKSSYESIWKTLERMAILMLLRFLIIADSYFRGLQAVEAMIKQRKHVLFSCVQTCPSLLFRNDLYEKLKIKKDCKSVYEIMKRKDGKEIPFIANSFLLEKRKICTLMTVYSLTKIHKSFDVLINNGNEENQYERKQVQEIRLIARVKY